MPQRIRTALFVDFDNIFISLQRHQPDAAQLFARGPDRWLKWLENDGPMAYPELGDSVGRRVLVRRCYINPKTFSQFRSFFIRAG
ncbi:MAG: NYN domain-containing protein, partial [Acidobacteriota bacterium]